MNDYSFGYIYSNIFKMPKLSLDDVCAKLATVDGITSQSRKVCEAVGKPSSQGSVLSGVFQESLD